MFKIRNRSLLPIALVSLFILFGVQLAAGPYIANADETARVFTNKDDFKADDFKDFDKEDFEDFDKEDFEDFDRDDFEGDRFNGFKDEDVLRLILQRKGSRGDLEKLFGDERNLDRFFDEDINKGFLTRDDLEKELFFNRRLLEEADKRAFFVDRDDDEDFFIKGFNDDDDDDDDDD